MNYNYHQEHVAELKTIPENYSIEAAIQNNEIVVSPVLQNNTKRFYEFLSNYERGLTDKVRIISYGIDNPEVSSRAILEYNGKFFIYTFDSTIPQTLYGDKIIVKPGSFNSLIYYLVTYDRIEFPIFYIYSFKIK